MAVVTVPPVVTLVPLMIRLASVSPPVVTGMVPTAVSSGLAAFEPAGSSPRAGSAASLTVLSPATEIVGVESASSAIVTFARLVSPSPSVIV